MKIIYSHLNINDFDFSDELSHSDYAFDKLPEYAQVSFDQSSKFGEVVLVDYNSVKKYKDEINDFFNICKKGFPSFYKDPFWLLTLLRLHTLFIYIRENNIQEFVHIEYDNLIYHSCDHLSQLPKGIYFTQLGPQCGSAGMVYCNSITHFEKFIDRIKQILEKGENVMRQFTSYDHLSEMVMIDLVKQHTQDIDYLPLLPSDKYYDILGFVYDGASYGQYIGGTNVGHGPGFYANHQWIGQAIYRKDITDIYMRNKPYVKFNNIETPIFNLHIHSKKLEDFV